MKRLRKGILLTLLALCVAMGAMVVGCGKKETVTIQFELNGGDTQSFEPFEAVVGEDIILKIPTRDGYEFTGWYDNQALTGTPFMGGSLQAPETDTIYYASWAELVKVTLDGGGGTFSDGSTSKDVYVAKGKKLLSALSEHIPTRGTLQFGAWFMGGTNEVTEETTVPSRAFVLTAKYKVGYSVEIYKQRDAETYEHDTSADFTDMGYFDDEFTVPAPTIDGFEFFRNHPQGAVTLKLQEDSSKNVFKLYYNKSAYTIIYNVNAPESTSYTGYMADQRVMHGTTGVALECGYSIRSYRFAGWSKSASGNVDYKPGDNLDEGSYTLYAVWDEGYSDVFGGTDFIFFPHDGKNGTAILQRGNAEIVGRTNKENNGTYEEDINGMYVLFGGDLIAKLVDSTPKTFSFLDKDMQGEYAYSDPYYKSKTDTSGWKLELDGFDSAKLTRDTGVSDCTFSYDNEAGKYKLTDSKGASQFVILGKSGDNKVFSLVGEEAGTFQQVTRVSLENYGPGNYSLVLDGLGNASWVWNAMSTAIRGKYEAPIEKRGFTIIKVHFDDGSEMEFMMVEFTTMTAVIVKDYEGTFNSDINGELVLDGFQGFTGEAKFQSQELTYFIENTVLGTVINVLDGNNRLTNRFKLDLENHTYTEMSDDYIIYRYLYVEGQGINNIGNIYLVIYNNDKADGNGKKAEVMEWDGVNAAKKLYTGTVTESDSKPLSEFKSEGTPAPSTSFPYTSFKFFGSDMFAIGPLFYIYLEDDPNTTAVDATFMYMEERNSSRKLLFYTGLNTFAGYGLEGVGSFLVNADGTYTQGSIDSILFDDKSMAESKKFFGIDNFYSFSSYSATGTLEKQYFAVYQIGDDVATAKYEIEPVASEPMALAVSLGELPQGSNSPFGMEASLYLNGKGEARILMEMGESSDFVKGTYLEMGNVGANNLRGFRITLADDNYPDLKGKEIEIAISGLSSTYYYIYNGIMEGRNEIEGGGYVELDGWGTHALYVDNFGHEYEGYYCFLNGQNGIIIYEDMQTGLCNVYIQDGKFMNNLPELKGFSGGLWYLVDQNYEAYYKDGAAVHFDGEGGVIIEDLQHFMNWQLNGGDGNEYWDRIIYGRGFYTALSEFEYELTVGFYDDDGNLMETQTWVGKLENSCCVKMSKEDQGAYIQDSDKSVLYLDGYGAAVYVDHRGNREEGSYLFVDKQNGIGMFINDVTSYMVQFNNTDYSFKILNNPEKFKTFYANDLSSIEFGYTLRVDGQEIGLWYFDDSNGFVFYQINDETGVFEKSTAYHYEEGDTYTDKVDGKDKVYKVWDEKEISLTGDIIFRAIDKKNNGQNGKITGAKLTFTPDGTYGINASAKLSFKDFRADSEEKEYDGVYSVKMLQKESIVGDNVLNTYQLFLCYGDLELPLSVDRANNTFNLWANVQAAGVTTDLLVFLGSMRLPFAELDIGTGYTLGVMNWSLSDWNISNDVLLGGYAKACDKNGDLIFFEVLWSEYEQNKDRVIGYTSETGVQGDVPIYEIFTDNLRGDGETVVLLEVIPAGSTIYFAVYAVCNFVEVKVNLPAENNGKPTETQDYKIFQERVITSTKGFEVGGIAYQHVYKKLENGDTSKEDLRVPGFESISTGYAAFVLNVDMLLVEDKTLTAGRRVLIITPTFVSQNNWNNDVVTLWFGIDKHIEASAGEMKDDPNFKGVSFDIILLTNEYREKNATGTDNRKVLDGWLVYYYILDEENNNIAYTFLYGYEYKEETKDVKRVSRIRCQDKVKMYDLSFSGTFDDPKIEYKEYIPPVEEEDKDDKDGE